MNRTRKDFSSDEAFHEWREWNKNNQAQLERDQKARAGVLAPEFTDLLEGRERRVNILVTRGTRTLGRFTGPASLQIPSARICAKFHSKDVYPAPVRIQDHDGVLDETWVDGRREEESFLA